MMVRSHYPYLLQQRRRWFVRMVVPVDVRDIIGQSIFKVPTGHTDEHQAATVAAPIIADLQARIKSAREDGSTVTINRALIREISITGPREPARKRNNGM